MTVDNARTLRTPLARVRGLGSAHHGAGAWWTMRLTSLALVPLGAWFVVSVISLAISQRPTFFCKGDDGWTRNLMPRAPRKYIESSERQPTLPKRPVSSALWMDSKVAGISFSFHPCSPIIACN